MTFTLKIGLLNVMYIIWPQLWTLTIALVMISLMHLESNFIRKKDIKFIVILNITFFQLTLSKGNNLGLFYEPKA